MAAVPFDPRPDWTPDPAAVCEMAPGVVAGQEPDVDRGEQLIVDPETMRVVQRIPLTFVE
jgi:hypothetical protein